MQQKSGIEIRQEKILASASTTRSVTFIVTQAKIMLKHWLEIKIFAEFSYMILFCIRSRLLFLLIDISSKMYYLIYLYSGVSNVFRLDIHLTTKAQDMCVSWIIQTHFNEGDLKDEFNISSSKMTKCGIRYTLEHIMHLDLEMIGQISRNLIYFHCQLTCVLTVLIQANSALRNYRYKSDIQQANKLPISTMYA